MAVEKTGTENEVIMFSVHSAEGQLCFMGQLAKGCLISVIVSFTGFKNQQRGKALMESIRSAHLS